MAKARTEARGGEKRRRQWAPDYELLGLGGEGALCAYLGCELDLNLTKPGGDGGVDTFVWLLHRGEPTRFPVQVKTSRKPKNLIVEEGQAIHSAIYVLCRWDDAEQEAYCLGWRWGADLAKAPVGDVMGKGVPYHFIPRGELRRMIELRNRVCTHG